MKKRKKKWNKISSNESSQEETLKLKSGLLWLMDTFTHVVSKKTWDKGDEAIIDLRNSKEMLYKLENSWAHSEDSIRKEVSTIPIISPWNEKDNAQVRLMLDYPIGNITRQEGLSGNK